jgi:hypothetical protein
VLTSQQHMIRVLTRAQHLHWVRGGRFVLLSLRQHRWPSREPQAGRKNSARATARGAE